MSELLRVARDRRITPVALAEVEGFYARMGFETLGRCVGIATNLSNLPIQPIDIAPI